MALSLDGGKPVNVSQPIDLTVGFVVLGRHDGAGDDGADDDGG